jgi:hypothetical protein
MASSCWDTNDLSLSLHLHEGGRRDERSLSLAESVGVSSVYDNDNGSVVGRRDERSLSLAESVCLSSLYDDENASTAGRRNERSVSIGGSEYIESACMHYDKCADTDSKTDHNAAFVSSMLATSHAHCACADKIPGTRPHLNGAKSSSDSSGSKERPALLSGASMDVDQPKSALQNGSLQGIHSCGTTQNGLNGCDHGGSEGSHAGHASAVKRKMCEQSTQGDRMLCDEWCKMDMDVDATVQRQLQHDGGGGDDDDDDDDVFGGADRLEWLSSRKLQKTCAGAVRSCVSSATVGWEDSEDGFYNSDAFCMGITRVHDGYALLGAPMAKGMDRFKVIFGSDPIVP